MVELQLLIFLFGLVWFIAFRSASPNECNISLSFFFLLRFIRAHKPENFFNLYYFNNFFTFRLFRVTFPPQHEPERKRLWECTSGFDEDKSFTLTRLGSGCCFLHEGGIAGNTDKNYCLKSISGGGSCWVGGINCTLVACTVFWNFFFVQLT